MTKLVSIQAEARDRIGKGASRQARRDGLVPAVIYGDNKEPVSIQIPQNEIIRLINRGGFMSQTYEIDVAGKKSTVLARDLQLHPVSDMPMHIDFFRLAKGATVVMSVPLNVTGSEESPGLKRGGVINYTRHEVELEVPVDAIPEQIDVSVAGADVGEAIKISSVTLPEGVKPTITDRDFVLVTVVAPSGMKSAEAGSDAAEGEE